MPSQRSGRSLPPRARNFFRVIRYGAFGSLVLASVGLSFLIWQGTESRAQDANGNVWQSTDPEGAVKALLLASEFTSFEGIRIGGRTGEEPKTKSIMAAAYNTAVMLKREAHPNTPKGFEVVVDEDSIENNFVYSGFPKLQISPFRKRRNSAVKYQAGENSMLLTLDGKEELDLVTKNVPMAKAPWKMPPSIYMFQVVNEKVVAEKVATARDLQRMATEIEDGMSTDGPVSISKIMLGKSNITNGQSLFELRVDLDDGFPVWFGVNASQQITITVNGVD